MHCKIYVKSDHPDHKQKGNKMLTWIIDQHVDRVKGVKTPFIDEARARGHIVHGLRDSLIPKQLDVSHITISRPTIVRGSHGFVNYVQRELSPTPGGFYNPAEFEPTVFAPIFKELFLNYGYQVTTYGNFITNRDKFRGKIFIKPLNNIKLFNGITIEDGEDLSDRHYHKFLKWFAPDTSAEIVVSPAVEVGKEYRMVVVDKTPVAGSEYKVENKEQAPKEVYEFVEKLTQIWNPMDVYVIDIAETSNGYKIVEYNQFGSSGVYECDQSKIIDALEILLT